MTRYTSLGIRNNEHPVLHSEDKTSPETGIRKRDGNAYPARYNERRNRKNEKLIGFCSLIRLLISISRREVFTSANVRRLRWFAYTSASLEILIAVDEWIVGNAAVEQISLPGYKIISYAGYSPDWVAVIIPILFAEIFAIGAKMKEEQDLTI